MDLSCCLLIPLLPFYYQRCGLESGSCSRDSSTMRSDPGLGLEEKVIDIFRTFINVKKHLTVTLVTVKL